MKLIGAVLIFAVFTWGGFGISQGLKNRCVFFEQLLTALELLKTEIAFSGVNLKTAFENAARHSGAQIFEEAAKYIEREGINLAWRKAVETSGLSGEDSHILLLLSSKLGKTDANGQIKHIDYVSGLIKEEKKRAVSKYESVGGLYRRGGALMGIFAILLLM